MIIGWITGEVEDELSRLPPVSPSSNTVLHHVPDRRVGDRTGIRVACVVAISPV